MTDLKTCPFCGKPAEHDTYDPFDGYQGDCSVHRVLCTGCGAQIKARTEEAAAARWNMRCTAIPKRDSFEDVTSDLEFYTILGYPLKGLLLLADAMKRLEIPVSDVEMYMHDAEKPYENVFKMYAEEQRRVFKNVGYLNMDIIDGRKD